MIPEYSQNALLRNRSSVPAVNLLICIRKCPIRISDSKPFILNEISLCYSSASMPIPGYQQHLKSCPCLFLPNTQFSIHYSMQFSNLTPCSNLLAAPLKVLQTYKKTWKNSSFWDVVQCVCFRETCCLHIQGRRISRSEVCGKQNKL